MVLVKQVEVERLGCSQVRPSCPWILCNSLCEAGELVVPKRLVLSLKLVLSRPAKILAVFDFLFALPHQLKPARPVIHPTEFHMFGLRDLFVWKQKATTDAPDTYTA